MEKSLQTVFGKRQEYSKHVCSMFKDQHWYLYFVKCQSVGGNLTAVNILTAGTAVNPVKRVSSQSTLTSTVDRQSKPYNSQCSPIVRVYEKFQLAKLDFRT